MICCSTPHSMQFYYEISLGNCVVSVCVYDCVGVVLSNLLYFFSQTVDKLVAAYIVCTKSSANWFIAIQVINLAF